MGWIPRRLEDFGDGGAFPEIHLAQYPLGMGRKDSKLRNRSGGSGGTLTSGTSTQLALQVDREGRVQYDQIVRQGHGKDKIVYSKFTDLIEATNLDERELAKPDEEFIAQNTDRTRAALEKVINSKVASSFKAGGQFENASQKDKEKDTVYYRYTPARTAGSDGKNETRIVRMEEADVDPLAPVRLFVIFCCSALYRCCCCCCCRCCLLM